MDIPKENSSKGAKENHGKKQLGDLRSPLKDFTNVLLEKVCLK